MHCKDRGSSLECIQTAEQRDHQSTTKSAQQRQLPNVPASLLPADRSTNQLVPSHKTQVNPGNSPLSSGKGRKGPTQDAIPASESQPRITALHPQVEVEESNDSQNTSNFKPKGLTLGPDRPSTHSPAAVGNEGETGETKVKISFWACLVRKFKAIKTKEPLKNENFIRTIEIVFKIDGSEVKRNARALFDTGCSKNLVSREFLENEFHMTLGSSVNGLTFVTADGRDLETIGAVTGRWAAATPGLDRTMPDQKLYFNAKFYKDSFYIPKNTGLPSDVVVGTETILESDLLHCRHLACLGWRRRAPPSVKDRELQQASEKQKISIAENERSKEELLRQLKPTTTSKPSLEKSGCIPPPD